MLTSNLSLGLFYNFDSLAVDELFVPVIKDFLSYHSETATSFDILQADKYITSYDFKDSSKIPIKHIYLNFLNNIERKDKILSIPISVFITFDKYQCSNYCSYSNRYYSYISIGGANRVFYVLFNIDEIFEFIYTKETSGKIEYLKSINNELTNIENYNNKEIKHNESSSTIHYVNGYLDNHNLTKGLSFISVSDEDGYPIYHSDFPSIIDIDVGSILELEINKERMLNKVIGYKLSDLKEIENVIQSFTGILNKINSVGFINTNIENMSPIFVPSRLAENFDDSKFTKVVCLARNKKPLEPNQYKWSALRIIEKK